MKIKSSIYALTTFLFLCCLLSVSHQNTYASRWNNYEHPRVVEVIKPTKIYKIKIGHPRYKSHVVATKTLKNGQKVKIQTAASYTWIVTHKGWSNGYFKTNGKYFWECPTEKGWYKLK